MQVIILNAWKSSRMKPLSDKSSFLICWKTAIEFTIENLISVWIKDFLIVCNNENIKSVELKMARFSGIQIECVIQENQNDWMKWAVLACGKRAKKNVFIVSSNDIVDKSVFTSMLLESQKQSCYWLICGKVVDKYFPWWYISQDGNAFLRSIVEKPGEWKEPSNQINLALHIWNDFHDFQKRVANIHNSTDDAYEKTIQNVCSSWEKIKIVEYNWYWQALKYPWHMLRLMEYFLWGQENYIDPSVEKWENVIIKGKWVVIMPWVRILENSVISGPCYIGSNTIIWNNCLVRWSSIWNDCVIGFGSEICRSLVHNKVWTHSNYVWDSIVDSNVSFGSWTTTWNLRLDEKDVFANIKWERVNSYTNKLWTIIWANTRLWINISINPWIKIWSNSMICGWVVLDRDVDEWTFVCGKVERIEKPNKFGDVKKLERCWITKCL